MKKNLNRRNFAKTVAAAGIGSVAFPVLKDKDSAISNQNVRKSRLKISLNAYSFDKPLRSGSLTMSAMLDYCASKGFDGVDLTGYYFPGYPAVPPDDFIYNIKKKAFRLGLGISGTGVRNDFTWADASKRAAEKQLVKDWIVVAEKLGAPLVRIFSGNLSKENFSRADREKWIAEDIRECAEFGKNHGVMIGLQNHNDFLKTSADVESMMKLAGSDWTGLLLDIGSYHSPDPYSDIALTSKYAISWQLKEKIFINDTQIDTDYKKIIEIVLKSGYSGYLPLETLGDGDPAVKIEALLNKVNTVLQTV